MKNLKILKGRKIFQEVFRRGKRFSAHGVRIIIVRIDQDIELYFKKLKRDYDRDRDIIMGITISRKCGNAVYRNRMKRRTKSIFRELLPAIKTGYIIVASLDDAGEKPDYTAVRTVLNTLLIRAGALNVHEN